MSDREEHVRKTDKFISKIIELWPFWVLVFSGAVGSIRFYDVVKGLADDQKAWKAVSDQRRENNRQEFEDLRRRLTILETNMEWLKKTK